VRYSRFVPFIALAISAAFMPTLARADQIIYMLDQNGCTGGCGSSPYGKVTLTDSGAGSTSVMVMVELSFGETFAGTGAGERSSSTSTRASPSAA